MSTDTEGEDICLTSKRLVMLLLHVHVVYCGS